MVTRRSVLRAGGLLGASAVLTLHAPELARAAERLVASPGRAPDLSGTRLVASLAAGGGPDELGVRSGRGIDPGGPEAVAVLADGRLAILDTINGRVSYLVDGRPSGTQSLPGALHALDMEALGSTDLACFDPSACKFYLIRAGTVIARDVPRGDIRDVSRLTRARDHAMFVEGDSETFDARQPRSTRTHGFPDERGGHLSISYERVPVRERRQARIRQGDGATFDIVTTHALGSVVSLGRDQTGRSYFQVSELVPSAGGLDVDLTLRRFAPDGAPAGVTRVPVRGRHSSPRRAACFAPNGDAFALFPEARQVRILQLEWSTAIAPLQTLSSGIAASLFIAHALHGPQYQIANCRATAIEIGQQYAHGTWIATQANLNHHLRNDVAKPAYLVGPGQYFELPYCWGGMHLPAGFINEMNAGSLAGNSHTTWIDPLTGRNGGFRPGTSSVDCSGMIQQCWGVGGGHKQNDAMLMDWVTEHNVQDVGATLSPGDMWRLAGQHVRMHRDYRADGTGAYMIESTMAEGNKCWNAFRPWSDYTGYTWNKGNFAC